MKASLDTNAIIHFYRANMQNILFDFFEDGVMIYEQIRNVELANHGKDVLSHIDEDIEEGKVELYTDEMLREASVFMVFKGNFEENRSLYGAGDLGEIYAISLAQTLGANSLVTNDTKRGGPYMSLLQFDDDIMPFTFSDILIIRYLCNGADAERTLSDFDSINEASNLNWSFKSQIEKFIRRFFSDPYKSDERIWMEEIISKNKVNAEQKFITLRHLLRQKL